MVVAAHDSGKAPAVRNDAWQRGYAAFTVSASQLAKVRSYIENQEAHHRTMTFEEELIKLLDAHGIEYNERYLWD